MAYFDAHPGEYIAPGRSASSPVPPPTPTPRRHRPDGVPQPTPFSAYSGISPTALETPPLRPAATSRSPYGRKRGSKSPGLGMAALAMTIGANLTVALAFLPMIPMLSQVVALARRGQQVTPGSLATVSLDPSLNWVLTGASWVGIIAFVLGIVAAMTNRGRGMGVLTIVLSFIGPALVLVFWFMLAASL